MRSQFLVLLLLSLVFFLFLDTISAVPVPDETNKEPQQPNHVKANLEEFIKSGRSSHGIHVVSEKGHLPKVDTGIGPEIGDSGDEPKHENSKLKQDQEKEKAKEEKAEKEQAEKEKAEEEKAEKRQAEKEKAEKEKAEKEKAEKEKHQKGNPEEP